MRHFPEIGSVDVLFVAYGGGHIQMVIPVAKALQASGLRVWVLALTTAIDLAARANLNHFTFADFPSAQSSDILELGRQLVPSQPDGAALPLNETRAYMAINMQDLILQHGKPAAEALWQTVGRQGFFPLNAMKSMLASIAPQLVVATNSPRAERAAVEAATALRIPAIAMVDMFALQEVAWLAKPNYGNKLLVLNDGVRQMMIDHGRPADSVIVTGNPAFDSLNDPQTRAAGHALRHKRGWGENGRRTVLYASGPEPEFHPFTGEPGNTSLPSDVETQLRALIKDDPTLELVLRRHPSENQKIAVGANIHISPRDEDINTLLHAVDLVVVVGSTVGLQGFLAGRPVISVEGSVFTKDAPFGAFGMATAVKLLPDLGPTVLEVLAQSDCAPPRALDGPATNRVAQVLTTILTKLDLSRIGAASLIG